jgi:hypothetical protein
MSKLVDRKHLGTAIKIMQSVHHWMAHDSDCAVGNTEVCDCGLRELKKEANEAWRTICAALDEKLDHVERAAFARGFRSGLSIDHFEEMKETEILKELNDAWEGDKILESRKPK